MVSAAESVLLALRPSIPQRRLFQADSATQLSSEEAFSRPRAAAETQTVLVLFYNPWLKIKGAFPPPRRTCSDRCVLTS